MTFFARYDAPQDTGHRLTARSAGHGRGAGSRRIAALAVFLEEIGILFRYATGRDYYERGAVAAKD